MLSPPGVLTTRTHTHLGSLRETFLARDDSHCVVSGYLDKAEHYRGSRGRGRTGTAPPGSFGARAGYERVGSVALSNFTVSLSR